MAVVFVAACLIGFIHSDAPPASDDCYDDTFCIESSRSGDSVHVFVRNLKPWEFTMTLDMRIENASPDVSLPITRSFEPSRKTRIATLAITDPRKGWSFSFDMKWMFGSISAIHDRGISYRLPYRRGAEYMVGQGAYGGTTHQGIHAIDWDMPEGTEVLAARDGVVIDLQEDFHDGGVDPALKSQPYVTVAGQTAPSPGITLKGCELAIGTHDVLLQHLRVRVGDRVRAGQSIAYSGNTGYSSGPHLHFEVYSVTSELDRQTYPVRFTAFGSAGTELNEGHYYGH